MQLKTIFGSRPAAQAIICAWLLCLGQPSFAANVRVEGNKRVDSETIASYFTGSDEASVNKGIKDLYATGLFSSVKVSRADGQIVVMVVENRVINRVAFEGNSKIKTETLAAEIQSKSRGPYSEAMVAADVERIKDIYRRAGRAAASVTSRIVDLPNGRVDVVFTIDEGEKTGVKAINFVGNNAYSSGKLRDLMETTEMNFLSWLKTSDVYDPDRIASDLERIRRFYLKNGYADFRVIGSDAQFDPAQGGYIITITLEEGVQYRVGAVNVESHLVDIDSASLQSMVRIASGDIYDGDKVQKTVDALTKEVGKHGYPFTQVRPRGDKDPATRTVNIAFVLEEGPRAYIERIEIHGNTRTRDYVIRREFEIGEGDAYNKTLIDRAERRLNNLGYFKKVKITNERGSASDRVIIVVEVEDQPTGALSLSGGYSTTDGFIAEVSVSESNFMGRGQYVKLSLSEGQFARGVEFNFTEPYFLGERLAAGFDVYAKKTDAYQFSYYSNFIAGGGVRLGLPITEELSFAPRYSLYRQDISVPNNSSEPFNDCPSTGIPIFGITPGFGNGIPANYAYNCLVNGEASLAIKEAQGPFLTSLFGYTLSYNSLDSNKNPTSGLLAEIRQDAAGAGGDARYLRTTGDLRFYYDIWDPFVGLVHLQGGDIQPFGGYQLRIIDNFNMGPSLVRGFAPFGIGPRDVSFGLNPEGNPLGGTKYFGASAEIQFPLFGVPRDLGLKGAVFFDAGTLYGFEGKTVFPLGAAAPFVPAGTCIPSYAPSANPILNFTQSNCITVGANSSLIRTSAGGSIIWSSPLGPIRFDFAKAITKSPFDQTQFFFFTGGTTF